jgi:hypothetical protein
MALRGRREIHAESTARPHEPMAATNDAGWMTTEYDALPKLGACSP